MIEKIICRQGPKTGHQSIEAHHDNATTRQLSSYHIGTTPFNRISHHFNNIMSSRKRKQERPPPERHFSPGPIFVATIDELGAQIFGKPLPYKRPGQAKNHGGRFNANRPKQDDFTRALKDLHRGGGRDDLCDFGGEELEATFIFEMPRQSSVAPCIKKHADIDNLAKFVMDALQHVGVYMNDAQISRLVAEKRLAPVGSSGSTTMKISKRIIEIDD